MKKFIFTAIPTLLLATLLFANWDKDKKKKEEASSTPTEVIGAWQMGSASFTDIWSTDGFYLGNAFELSIRFVFKKNGTYEQYFVAASRLNGGCRTNVFNIEYGRVTFDAANKTFTTKPTHVKNKFFNCGSVSKSEAKTNLKSNTYKWRTATAPSGTPVLEIQAPGATTYSIFYKQE